MFAVNFFLYSPQAARQFDRWSTKRQVVSTEVEALAISANPPARCKRVNVVDLSVKGSPRTILSKKIR